MTDHVVMWDVEIKDEGRKVLVLDLTPLEFQAFKAWQSGYEVKKTAGWKCKIPQS